MLLSPFLQVKKLKFSAIAKERWIKKERLLKTVALPTTPRCSHPFPFSCTSQSPCPNADLPVPQGKGALWVPQKGWSRRVPPAWLEFLWKEFSPSKPQPKPAVFRPQWEKGASGVILGWALESDLGRVQSEGEEYYSSLSSVFQVPDVHHLTDCPHPPWGHQYHFHPLSEETESQGSWVPKFSIIWLSKAILCLGEELRRWDPVQR